ncbi:MAG: hypothetical protein ACK5MK_07625 [Dysgonomonas sp.]
MKKCIYLLLPIIMIVLISCGDKDIVYKGVNAEDFGFSPNNTANENVIALQKAIDSNNAVYVKTPGVYDLNATIYLKSNCSITFGPAVYIRKKTDDNGYGAEYVFINRGAYTRTYDENIEINGLNLICNKLDDRGGTIQGIQGQIAFFYIKNLTIKNFNCTDLLLYRFCLQICEFENILIDNARIEGDKDGIHLGVGKNFIIRNSTFSTFDDPIALNAHDYDTSNPTVGWIENGLIENCYDLEGHGTTGFFCRILAGSWLDWHQGMELQKSDIVVSNGRLYRVISNVLGQKYISHTAPTHTNGYQVIDGINWYMMQDNVVYNAGCRNIHFRNIYLQKERDVAFSLHFDNDNYSRSYYPNSQAPRQDNITFEKIHLQNKFIDFISCMTPVDTIKMIDINWSGGNVSFQHIDTDGIDYKDAYIKFENCRFSEDKGIILTRGNRKATLSIRNSIMENTSSRLGLYGNIAVKESDIPFYYIE